MKKLHHYVARAKIWAKYIGYRDKSMLRWYVERAFVSNKNKNMNTLEITCEKDPSSLKISDKGERSNNYFILLTTKGCGIDVEQVLFDFNESSGMVWEYKMLCQDNYYIFTIRIDESNTLKIGEKENRVIFIIKTEYLPTVKSRWIKVIK